MNQKCSCFGSTTTSTDTNTINCAGELVNSELASEETYAARSEGRGGEMCSFLVTACTCLYTVCHQKIAQLFVTRRHCTTLESYSSNLLKMHKCMHETGAESFRMTLRRRRGWTRSDLFFAQGWIVLSEPWSWLRWAPPPLPHVMKLSERGQNLDECLH